ncbi:MAG: glycosyltransferase [Bacteroidia bacterium]|jgi:hypothetical protein
MKIFFVCDSRDYHTIDWCVTVRSIVIGHEVAIISDVIPEKNGDNELGIEIIPLINIARFINGNSRWIDLLRNAIKLMVVPLQALKLRKIFKQNPNDVFHAHSMYYVFLCWMAGIRYIATPMGSDVLVRPFKSKTYKFFTRHSLKHAHIITVDSVKLQKTIKTLCNRDSLVIQNGVDVPEIQSFNKMQNRTQITSIRGFYELYQIEDILKARNANNASNGIDFVYPYFEKDYLAKMLTLSIPSDRNLGRLTKEQLYDQLYKSKLVISIPYSDSSPRSVYEAIFCGCAVAVTNLEWIDDLPPCMVERLFKVDLQQADWFDKALKFADLLKEKPYVPTQQAISMYDQYTSMKNVCETVYKITT